MILGNFVVARLYSSAVRIIYGYPGDGDRNFVGSFDLQPAPQGAVVVVAQRARTSGCIA